MTPLEAFILALLQGITEFLPISSSAHLILAPYLFGWQEHDLRFDVVTNAGTLLAALFYFRHDLLRAWRARWSRDGDDGASRPAPLLPAVVLASLPVLAVGFLFYDWFATTARDPVLIATSSIVFGLLLGWADRAGSRHRDLGSLNWNDAVVIGAAEAVALVPGTSRSGITITAGLLRGYSREEAARFSFLLAIPVGLAAFVRDLFDLATHPVSDGDLGALAIGFVASAVSAYLVIGWLLAWLRRQDMTIFVVYRIVLGVVTLAVVWSL